MKKKNEKKMKNQIYCENINTFDAKFIFDSISRNFRDFEHRNYIITLLFIELQRFELIFTKQNVNYELSHYDIVIMKLKYCC